MTDDEPRPQPAPWSSEGGPGAQWFGAILVAIGVVLLAVAFVQWQDSDEDPPLGTTKASEEAERTDQAVLALIGAGLAATETVLIVRGRGDDEG